MMRTSRIIRLHDTLAQLGEPKEVRQIRFEGTALSLVRDIILLGEAGLVQFLRHGKDTLGLGDTVMRERQLSIAELEEIFPRKVSIRDDYPMEDDIWR